MAKPRGLGRGIESLIPAAPAARTVAPAADGTGPTRKVPASRVRPSPWQPRQDFDPEKLANLAQSIEKQGLMFRPLVREKDGGFELVAGERRFRAMTEVLGWSEIPVDVCEYDDSRMLELAITENIQRDDLNALEVAEAYKRLKDEAGLTHEDIAGRVGVSRSQVTNTLRLLELPGEVKKLVFSGELPAGSARALLGLSNPVAQIRLAKKAVADGLSTRVVERLASNQPKEKSPGSGSPARKADAHVVELEERLQTHFATKVTVDDNGGKGRIVIEYYSVDEANRILKRMGLPEE